MTSSVRCGRRGSASLGAEVLLAEYQALKAEQLARIGTRDNLLYALGEYLHRESEHCLGADWAHAKAIRITMGDLSYEIVAGI